MDSLTSDGCWSEALLEQRLANRGIGGNASHDILTDNITHDSIHLRAEAYLTWLDIIRKGGDFSQFGF